MVDTARFHLGVHAIRAVRQVLATIARDEHVHPLVLLTYLPLDAQSIARILDSFTQDQLIARSDAGVRWIGPPPADGTDLEHGEYLEAPGFTENLVQLRNDPDWCRRVRDQHRVLRALATLGTSSALVGLAEHADLPPPRLRAALGDFEAEEYVELEPIGERLEVIAPDIEYPPERFERNNGLLTAVESRAVPVHRGWWVVLGVAAVVLVLFIASRIATLAAQ